MTWTTAARIAWQQLLGALTALAALAFVLPGPTRWVDSVGGRSSGASMDTGGSSVVEIPLLLVAALAVWLLLLWGSTVALVALAGRLPGCAGRAGRALLARIAPGVARNLVLGAAVIGCLAAGGTGVATAASVTTAAVTGLVDAGPGTTIGRTADGTIVPFAGRAGPGTSWTSVEGSVVQPGSQLSDPVDGAEAASAGQLDIDWPPPAGRTRTAAPAALLDIDWPAAATPVVVRRGDSLWSIAAHHLPAGAGDAQIQKASQQWFVTNAAVIGPDPNLILPGQILQSPPQETDH